MKDYRLGPARRHRQSSSTEGNMNLNVPGELVPAFGADRPELVKLAKPEAKTKEQVAVLYDLIAGLLARNRKLREELARYEAADALLRQIRKMAGG